MKSKLTFIGIFAVRYSLSDDRVSERDFSVVNHIFFKNMYGI